MCATFVYIVFCRTAFLRYFGTIIIGRNFLLEDYYRHKQLLDDVDNSILFAICSLIPVSSFKLGKIFDPDSLLKDDRWTGDSMPLIFANGNGFF